MIPIELKNYKWNQYFDLTAAIGSDLNGRAERFMKSRFLETALARNSRSTIKRVDQIGYDHELLVSGQTMEMKTQQGCLFTEVRKHKKAFTKPIKLTNTLSKTLEATLEVTADWLLLVDTLSYGAALVPYSVAVEKAQRTADGFEVRFEQDDLIYLFTPDEYTPGKSLNLNLAAGLEEFITTRIDQVLCD